MKSSPEEAEEESVGSKCEEGEQGIHNNTEPHQDRGSGQEIG